MITDSLTERALSLCETRKVADVRAGLGYTCVMLEDGACGLAYTFRNELGDCCGIMSIAGSMTGMDAEEIIPWVKSGNRLKAAIGLAAINAVINAQEKIPDSGNVMEALSVGPSDTFGMVGNFKPILESVKQKTNKIYVFERNVQPESGLFPSESIPEHLPKCDVLVVTATSIINHTFDDIAPYWKSARQICLVGPSTPLCPEVFKNYGVTLLAGSVVKKAGLILQIVSQGGGTMSMKPAVLQVLVRV
ncbi:MAG: hypothetical protein EOM54_01925 [Clostridia bacterium]|nr:hypothetical protein [Clostridia bacterium]